MQITNDAEHKQIEKDLSEALAERRRLQPNASSLPKHFVAFHDAEHRCAEAQERLDRYGREHDEPEPSRH